MKRNYSFKEFCLFGKNTGEEIIKNSVIHHLSYSDSLSILIPLNFNISKSHNINMSLYGNIYPLSKYTFAKFRNLHYTRLQHNNQYDKMFINN